MVPQCPQTVEELIKGKVLLSLLKTHEPTAECPHQGFRCIFYLAELALSDGACPLKLDVGYLFLVGSNTPLLMIVQHLVVILVFSQKMSTCPYGELDKIKIKTRDSRR